jgi:hypothetical protein
MSKRVSKEQFLRDLREFGEQARIRGEEIPIEILKKIRQFIIVTNTIDTGKLYVAFEIYDEPSANGAKFLIDTRADPERFGIEGFTEFPRPAYGLEGRYYIKQGIEETNLEPIFDSFAANAFGL